MDLDTLLTGLKQRRGSDLYLTADSPPLYRVDGATVAVEDRVWLAGEVESVIRAVLSPAESDEFDRTHELNLARALSGVGRFRLNVFRQRGQMGLVARLIPIDFPNAETLGLPASLIDLIMQKRGLILVTGATGSGKSTTLAALIDHRNIHTRGHILTIEDPIEFVHQSKKCLVRQREVGPHSHSFSSALRASLREDPDVILVGELRDLETTQLAISAAETGHLVFATLHTNSASKTVDRIIDIFPAGQQAQVRTMLSESIEGVVAQSLLPSKDGKGRVAALEVLVGVPALRNLIREDKTAQIPSVIQTGSQYGMQTLEQSLRELVDRRQISREEAILKCGNPQLFEHTTPSPSPARTPSSGARPPAPAGAAARPQATQVGETPRKPGLRST